MGGDNPSCDGCPITIDWEPIGTQTRNLELYEYTRMDTRKRNKKKLSIPVQTRSQMLLDAGCTHKQIVDRALEINEIKKRRAESASSSGNELKKILGIDGFQKLSKNFQKSFANLGLGPNRMKRDGCVRPHEASRRPLCETRSVSIVDI